VPRLVLSLDGRLPQASVSLPNGDWRDVLSNQRVAGGERDVPDLFARFPVAVLVA
jgi:maltooligosyltrehalose synthase